MEAFELAIGIVNKLTAKGFVAYFAGGWVRDFVMGHPSSDIDIATNAEPQVVLDLFPKTIAVGLSFGIVIVVIDGHQFEVATFRRDINYVDGRRPSQIAYTSAEEDAKRRDFTINGMFYDPLDKRVIDYVGGKDDIKEGIVRTIGDPYERFFEDRLRMVRAVRFAARFSFPIERETQEAIQRYSNTLFPAVAKERVYQELTKITEFPGSEGAFIDLHRLGLLGEIFPALAKVHLHDIKERIKTFSHFPKGAPTVLYLIELFPDASQNELIAIFLDLKVSRRDIQLLEFAYNAKSILTTDIDDDVAWVYFYAHPHADILTALSALRFLSPAPFLEKHEARKKRLRPHIERLVEKKPLVTSQFLAKKGVKPSKNMGILLAQAERIAIRENLEDPEEIVEHLKQTTHWNYGQED